MPCNMMALNAEFLTKLILSRAHLSKEHDANNNRLRQTKHFQNNNHQHKTNNTNSTPQNGRNPRAPKSRSQETDFSRKTPRFPQHTQSTPQHLPTLTR